MAAPTKREHGGMGSGGNGDLGKRRRTEGEDAKCEGFLTWCGQHGLSVSGKVRIGCEGSVAQYGMVTVDDIAVGECLFEIPRDLVLGPDNCTIRQLLHEESSSLESPSGWLPLLVALMYEYNDPASRWKPYFTLVPDFSQLDPPMFWDSAEVTERLAGTGVPEAVTKDLKSLETEFTEKVQPFIKKHPDIFKDACFHDLAYFKRMVAFIMAYSFTEPGPEDDDDEEDEVPHTPVMVPMADVLNHVARSNAHLSFYAESLKMEATRPILKGEEVFNTYGELANWQLLQMYGFAEKYPENHFDTVDIAMAAFLKSVAAGKDQTDVDFIHEKWKFLKSVDILQEGGMFVVGAEGVLTEEEMFTTLKVLTMDRAAFTDYKEREGWSDADETHDEAESLTFDDIPSLPESWRHLLKKAAEARLADYPRVVEEEQGALSDPAWSGRSPRQRYSGLVRHGQLQLLTLLIETCS